MENKNIKKEEVINTVGCSSGEERPGLARGREKDEDSKKLPTKDIGPRGRGDGSKKLPTKDIRPRGRGDGSKKLPTKDIGPRGRGDGSKKLPTKDIGPRGRGEGSKKLPTKDIGPRGREINPRGRSTGHLGGSTTFGQGEMAEDKRKEKKEETNTTNMAASTPKSPPLIATSASKSPSSMAPRQQFARSAGRGWVSPGSLRSASTVVLSPSTINNETLTYISKNTANMGSSSNNNASSNKEDTLGVRMENTVYKYPIFPNSPSIREAEAHSTELLTWYMACLQLELEAVTAKIITWRQRELLSRARRAALDQAVKYESFMMTFPSLKDVEEHHPYSYVQIAATNMLKVAFEIQKKETPYSHRLQVSKSPTSIAPRQLFAKSAGRGWMSPRSLYSISTAAVNNESLTGISKDAAQKALLLTSKSTANMRSSSNNNKNNNASDSKNSEKDTLGIRMEKTLYRFPVFPNSPNIREARDHSTELLTWYMACLQLELEAVTAKVITWRQRELLSRARRAALDQAVEYKGFMMNSPSLKDVEERHPYSYVQIAGANMLKVAFEIQKKEKEAL